MGGIEDENRWDYLTISQLRLLCFFGLFSVTVTMSEASRETRTRSEELASSVVLDDADAAAEKLRIEGPTIREDRAVKEREASIV